MRSSFLLAVCIAILSATAYSQWVTHHNPIYATQRAKPIEYVLSQDPNFKTQFIRITNSVKSGYNSIVPEYSKRQAWNADESLMLLRSGDGETLLYDGSNYQFIRKLDDIYGDEVFWHPEDKNVIYYAFDSILYQYNVNTDETTIISVFNKYTWVNTRGEGNLSNDGRYYAAVGQQYNYITGEVVFDEIIVFDINERRVISSLPLPKPLPAGFDWVSISPLGNYVVVDYADTETGRFHGVEVYDKNLNFIWQLPLGAGHSDLGIDESGDEVLVMDIYDDETNRVYINKYKLSSGHSTTLLDLSPYFYIHISCRNIERSHWCFVSTFDNPGRLTHDSINWLPFEDEVFALKLDGSGEVQRIIHHHSRRFSPSTPDPDNSNYWAEPHATISRKGNRILFGSNWEQNIAQSNSVDTYVCDFSNFLSTNEKETQKSLFNIYPNPFSESTNIYYELQTPNKVRIDIFNSIGEKIATLVDEWQEAGRHSEELRMNNEELLAGLYFYRVQIGNRVESGKMIKL